MNNLALGRDVSRKGWTDNKTCVLDTHIPAVGWDRSTAKFTDKCPRSPLDFRLPSF